MEAVFVWNDRKAEANLKKHGLSFEEAQEVFFDPFHLVVDNYLIDGEQRLMAIGMTTAKVMLVAVIFVDQSEPDLHIYKLISARKANAYEQTLYTTQS